MTRYNSYQTINEFYNELKSQLTSDELTTFQTFFNKYKSESDWQAILVEPIDYNITRPEVGIYPTKSRVTTELEYEESLFSIYVDYMDMDETLLPLPKILEIESTKRKLKPIDSRVYPDKPTVRRRRKQWGGKPTYRTFELNPRKSRGYAMRSFKKQLPKIETVNYRKTRETMRRSISHVLMKTKITPIETQKVRMALDLFDAFQQFGYHLFEIEQEDTSSKKDAWWTYMSESALDDFLADEFQPNTIAFAELRSKIRGFIKDAWENYDDEAHTVRQSAYGYNLSREQVKQLQNADKSYMRPMNPEKGRM